MTNVMGTDPCDNQNHAVFNATTQKRNWVDPHTGLFEAHVPLPSITGNTGSGPVVDMTLFYSPVVNNQAGLGDGWSFAFTTYSEAHNQLTLHSGEVLTVQKGKALETTAVYASWEEDGTALRVKRRDGRVEILKQVSNSKIYVPASLTFDGYNFITLSWKALEHTLAGVLHYQILLTGINDPTRELVKVDYALVDGTGPVTITFWPDDAVETLAFTLAVKGYTLDTVTSPEKTTTQLTYSTDADCGELLTTIETFEGVKESVQYDGAGIAFPTDSKLSILPAVKYHWTECAGRPKHSRTFEYYVNKVGPGVLISESGRKVRFEYDTQHELVKETVEIGSNISSTLHAQQGERRVRTSCYEKSGKEREQSVYSEFQLGALSSNEQPGLFSVYAGFPGAEKKVANRLGLEVRPSWLMPLKVEPTKAQGVSFADNCLKYIDNDVFVSKYTACESDFRAPHRNYCLPELAKSYTYTWIVGLKELNVGAIDHTLRMGSSVDDAACIREEITYHRDGDFRLGRKAGIKRFATPGADLPPDEQWTFDYTLKDLELTTTTQQLDANKVARKTSQTHSILSGRLIRQEDELGNQVTFTYDTCGRLASRTDCAQSATYQQTTTYSYPDARSVITTSPDGSLRKVEEDGLGNVIAEYDKNPAQDDETKEDYWRVRLAITLDARGRKQIINCFDDADIADWCQIKYDDWDQECSRAYGHTAEMFSQYDPIALTRTEWTGTATDKHAQVTTYHDDGAVARIEWKNDSGTVYQTQTYAYTHARLVESQTTVGLLGTHAIGYTYDAAGRVLSEAHSETGTDPALSYTYHYSYPTNWLIDQALKIEIEVDKVRRTLGSRTFDGWGRVTALTRGDVAETFTYEGASTVPKTRSGADGNTLNYAYIKELGNRVSQISLASDPATCKTFNYATATTRTSSASEGERLLEHQHDLHDRIISQRAQTSTGKEKKVTRTYSDSGRLLSDTDALGKTTTYSYGYSGYRTSTKCGELSTVHTLDKQRLLSKEVVTQADFPNKPSMTITYVYDSRRRETARHFMCNLMATLSLEQVYFDDNRLQRIALKYAGQEIGSRELSYTAGGRLAECKTTGVWRPLSPGNQPIDSQVFTYDALGNVTQCVTYFGNQHCTGTYTYDVTATRLVKIEHDHSHYKSPITLSYDKAGRITQDQTGKKYTYDWLGRLIQAGSTLYTYNPLDQLMTVAQKQNSYASQLVYDGLQVRGEYGMTINTTSHLFAGSAACTVQSVIKVGVQRLLFELRDASGTVLMTFDAMAETLKHHAYTAYGEHSSEEPDSLLGFNGEYLDASSGQSPLGHGYRWYAPDSLQFHAQDSLSPFGEGGPHCYGYCGGDPVNRQDPTGHVGSGKIRDALRGNFGDSLPPPLSLGKEGALISAILWSGLGVLTAIVSGGTSLLLAAALVGAAIVASATAIAAVVVADSNPDLAKALGWVSLVFTVMGGVGTLIVKIGRLAMQLGRSGLQAARALTHKAAVALTRRANGLGSARSAYRVGPTNIRSVGEIDLVVKQPMDARQWLHSHLAPSSALANAWAKTVETFDAADLNTVVCSVTGVLGASNHFEGDETAAFINSQSNNQTWLPWGSFNIGRYGRL